MTSGQSIFGFIGRVLGTAVAMVCSIVIWYIVDQQTAGVIVMLWFFVFLEMYFFIKFQRFIAIFLVCIVTQILIIGYELQVRKIGIAAGKSLGGVVGFQLGKLLIFHSDEVWPTILSNLRTRAISTGLCCWGFFRVIYLDNISLSIE
jgi:hypothetical protein